MTELETWFETFWSTYPAGLARKRKGVKGVCWKSVQKLNPDKALQDLILGNMRELIRYDLREEKAHGKVDRWPHASTWINQERWTMLENIGSYSDLNEKIAAKKCACGNEAYTKGKCNDCYYKEQDKIYDQGINANNIKNGIGINPGESKPDYYLRCRAWLTKKGGLGKVLAQR